MSDFLVFGLNLTVLCNLCEIFAYGHVGVCT
jgi:hypothetical protein